MLMFNYLSASQGRIQDFWRKDHFRSFSIFLPHISLFLYLLFPMAMAQHNMVNNKLNEEDDVVIFFI